MKVSIKVTLAVFLCLVWASFENAYADQKPAKSLDKNLKSKHKTAPKLKDTKSLPVGLEEPAARVVEPSDTAPIK